MSEGPFYYMIQFEANDLGSGQKRFVSPPAVEAYSGTAAHKSDSQPCFHVIRSCADGATCICMAEFALPDSVVDGTIVKKLTLPDLYISLGLPAWEPRPVASMADPENPVLMTLDEDYARVLWCTPDKICQWYFNGQGVRVR